jgi:hypothetical protein
MNILKKLIYFGLGLAVSGAILFSLTTPVGAIDVLGDSCTAGGSSNAVCTAQDEKAEDTIKDVINMLLFAIGIIAVISIIIGGIKYVTSDGDAGKVKQAKDTILYSVIGLIVAMLAFAIVTFVVSNVG